MALTHRVPLVRERERTRRRYGCQVAQRGEQRRDAIAAHLFIFVLEPRRLVRGALRGVRARALGLDFAAGPFLRVDFGCQFVDARRQLVGAAPGSVECGFGPMPGEAARGVRGGQVVATGSPRGMPLRPQHLPTEHAGRAGREQRRRQAADRDEAACDLDGPFRVGRTRSRDRCRDPARGRAPRGWRSQHTGETAPQA